MLIKALALGIAIAVRSTRRSCAPWWCRRRCACSDAGTGGSRPARARACRRSRTRRRALRRRSPAWSRRRARRRGLRRRPDPANQPPAIPPRRADRAARPRRPPIPRCAAPGRGAARRLTEWWYYTGHLYGRGGRRYGFELVFFRAVRGERARRLRRPLRGHRPVPRRFPYDQRTRSARRPAAARRRRRRGRVPPGRAASPDLSRRAPAFAEPWRLARPGGTARRPPSTDGRRPPGALRARPRPDLDPPAALHHGDGFVDFGPAGSSYYYSRTRMTASGELTVDGEPLAVDGDRLDGPPVGRLPLVGGGGWDWFASNLRDGRDLTSRSYATRPAVPSWPTAPWSSRTGGAPPRDGRFRARCHPARGRAPDGGPLPDRAGG